LPSREASHRQPASKKKALISETRSAVPVVRLSVSARITPHGFIASFLASSQRKLNKNIFTSRSVKGNFCRLVWPARREESFLVYPRRSRHGSRPSDRSNKKFLLIIAPPSFISLAIDPRPTRRNVSIARISAATADCREGLGSALTFAARKFYLVASESSMNKNFLHSASARLGSTALLFSSPPSPPPPPLII
jgi:hypothetical protein